MHVFEAPTTRMRSDYYPLASNCRREINLIILEKMQRSFPWYSCCLQHDDAQFEAHLSPETSSLIHRQFAHGCLRTHKGNSIFTSGNSIFISISVIHRYIRWLPFFYFSVFLTEKGNEDVGKGSARICCYEEAIVWFGGKDGLPTFNSLRYGWRHRIHPLN